MNQGLIGAERDTQLLERAMAELGADRQDHVGRTQRLGAGPAIGQDAVERRIALAHRPATGHRRDDRCPEAASDRVELALGPGRDHAAARHDQGPRGARQHHHRLLDVGHVAGRSRAVPASRLRRIHARIQEVVGNRDHHRARPARPQQIEGAGDRARNRPGLAQRLRPARDRPEAVDLVGDLVERAEVAADQVGGDVGDDQHDRDRARIGLDERRQRVGGTGPGRHEHDTRLAAGARVAVGHERRPRLVTGQHVGDVVLAQQRVVDREIVEPRDAEHVADTLAPQRLDDELTAGRQHAHGDGGRGVGVALPREYRVSIAARIWAGVLPSRVPCITSRVMSRQRLQVAAWLVHVVRSPASLLM